MYISQGERKFATILAVVMLLVSAAYLIIIDTLVLVAYKASWTELSILDLSLLLIPAVCLCAYATVLVKYYIIDHSYTKCSKYAGTKFGDTL